MNTPANIALITADNPEVVAVRGVLDNMEAQALGLAIVDDASSQTATDMLKQLRNARKSVEDKQDAIIEPMNKALKAARATFKPLIEKYEGIEKDLKARQLFFLSERARKAEEEARRLQKEAEERALREAEEAQRRADEQKRMIEAASAKQAAELRESGNTKAAEAVEENAARASDIINQSVDDGFNHMVKVTNMKAPKEARFMRTDSGAAANLKKVWDFEVLDIKALPAEYLIPHAAALREAMHQYAKEGGLQPIPGVRFFQKDALAIR